MRGAKVLIAANTAEIADSFSIAAKEVLRRLGIPKHTKDGAGHWNTPFGSELVAVGVGGAIEGKGFTHIFIDDPVRSKEDAESEVVREKTWSWYKDSLWGRREPGCKLVLIMSRWHEDDITGRLKAGAHYKELWSFVTIKALAEEGDILGREIDEALWPERYDADALKREREENPANFNARYQASPSSATGDMFKVDKLRFIQAKDIDPEWPSVLAIDLGFSTGGDFTALAQCWRMPDGEFVLDVRRTRLESYERNRWIRTECDRRNVKVFIPQDPAGGKEVARTLTSFLAGHSVTTTVVRGKKVHRADPLAAQVNSGNVYIVDTPDGWALKEEMRVFPNGKHDDLIDASADAFKEIVTHGRGHGPRKKRVFL